MDPPRFDFTDVTHNLLDLFSISLPGALRSTRDRRHRGASFGASFVLTLAEALRAGATVRATELEEDEVKLPEQFAVPVREKVLLSGDEQPVRILWALPEKNCARLNDILGN